MSLHVCEKCGWNVIDVDIERHRRTCNPKRGAMCDELALIARNRFVPPIESTKLGYGSGYLTFEFNREVHLRVQPRSNGRFHVEELFCIGDLSPEEVLRLVDTIRTIHAARPL